MRLRLLGVLIVALAMGQVAKADPIYGYSVGVSMQNTCTPGSIVSIDAILLNTGSAPIVFAPTFSSGFPSAQGGSVPFGGVSGDGQWNVLSNGFSFGDFIGQFAGVTIDPGQAFLFSFGTFQAPMNQPMGTSAAPRLNFGIDFTDMVEGNLLGICPAACNFNNSPDPSFTLGNKSWSSNTTFFEGVVVDRTPISVPEPPSWEMAGIAGIAIAGSIRHLRKI